MTQKYLAMTGSKTEPKLMFLLKFSGLRKARKMVRDSVTSISLEEGIQKSAVRFSTTIDDLLSCF